MKTMDKTVNKEADSREFLELLKDLPDGDKKQVKGIMIGLVMARQQLEIMAPADAAAVQRLA